MIHFYSIAKCEYGQVLVSSCDYGITSVDITPNSKAKLISNIESRFGSGNILMSEEKSQIEKVLWTIEDPEVEYYSELHPIGTPFQKMVWQVIRYETEVGSLQTYKEIAERCGIPDAQRAVAQACASNPIFMLIPCHRIVPKAIKGNPKPSDLGQYRWGAALKKKLIEAERAALADTN